MIFIDKFVQAVFYFFIAAEKPIIIILPADRVSFFNAFTRWTNN